MKFMRYQDRLDALRERKLAAPVHIRIKPYNHCNHDCWYCAYRVSNLQLGEEMDTKDILPETKMFEIVDDAIEMGVKAVTFSGGGEPLLYKPLPSVIEKLAKGGIAVASLTNGSNLKGKMADAFAEYGSWIRISIDGWDNKSYADARHVKVGDFDRVVENMKNFTARKSDCVLGISFIVDKANCDHIFEACEIFKKAGVDHVSISGVVVDNDGAKNNEYHKEISEVSKSQIAEATSKLTSDDFSIVNHYHELEERFDKEYDYCPFMQFQTVIGADQCVYTCHDKAFNENGLLGSIADKSFKDFWFSEENHDRFFAINPSKICNHHCVAHLRNVQILDYLSINQDHAMFV